jgi:AmmeMemoRadiSam system protein A
MLAETHKQALLAIARESIRGYFAGDRGAVDVSEPMSDVSGVFVTLKRRGALRGCLGTLEMRGPLPSEVARCAQDSATRDPRFPPMVADELADVRIEISVLGPLEMIDPADERAIEIGRHGLVVEQGARRGLLLPQVAVEWGWTREQFLCHTCQKAGLPPDAWRQGVQVFRFAAEVFGEEWPG